MAKPVEREEGLAREALKITLLQGLIFLAAALCAFLLRFDFSVPPRYRPMLWLGSLIWLTVKTVLFQASGLNHRWWKLTTLEDVYSVGRWTVVACGFSAVVIKLALPGHFPGSILVLDLLLTLFFSLLARAMVRRAAENAVKERRAKGTRVVIYGAGACGMLLLRELRSNTLLPYVVCGFIDDQPSRRHTHWYGAAVLGTGAELSEVVAHYDVEEVLIAIPSATGAEMTAILQACSVAGVRSQTVPSLGDLVGKKDVVKQLRQIAVEDLLGRTPIQLDEAPIRSCVTGKTVLVTGAAGSIGSELCRQILRFSPGRLIVLDIAETPLFFLERELRTSHAETELFVEIGNVQNEARIAEVFARHRPEVVYHSAAYKHVPLMEAHLLEAVENNVWGTYVVATCAQRHSVSKFVLISTDKAVRPTNIMGATKRICELIVMNMPASSTDFIAVRFGNVLGSNGSIIPILKAQIEKGGPLTLTHPDMHRFFMTIPEASQLVLQASGLGIGGQIFVLDMGDLVPIRSLANNLILLSGLRPGVDIQITYVGIRPGEKLYEELMLSEEEVLETGHPKIRVLEAGRRSRVKTRSTVERLIDCCRSRDHVWARELIRKLVPEYIFESVEEPLPDRATVASPTKLQSQATPDMKYRPTMQP